jgi:hypothetical protein
MDFIEQSDVHLEEFKAAGVSVPEVNQIELHPFCQQKPIVRHSSLQFWRKNALMNARGIQNRLIIVDALES